MMYLCDFGRELVLGMGCWLLLGLGCRVVWLVFCVVVLYRERL